MKLYPSISLLPFDSVSPVVANLIELTCGRPAFAIVRGPGRFRAIRNTPIDRVDTFDVAEIERVIACFFACISAFFFFIAPEEKARCCEDKENRK